MRLIILPLQNSRRFQRWSRRLFCFSHRAATRRLWRGLRLRANKTSRLDPPKPTQARFGGFWRNLPTLHFTAPHLPLLDARITIPPALPRQQSIVGYQEIAVPQGSSMRTATFKALSGNYKISDIQVKGAAGGGMDYAQKINADGSWGDMYYYLTMDGTGYVEDGWYKDEFGDVAVSASDTLAAGESMIFTASASMTLTFPTVLPAVE